MDELKIYVFHNCFCDYTCGMGVVLATSKEHAISVMKDRYLSHQVCNGGTGIRNETIYSLDMDYKVDEYEINGPMAFWVFGGG